MKEPLVRPRLARTTTAAPGKIKQQSDDVRTVLPACWGQTQAALFVAADAA
ncbi:MAG: hypothetical protein ACRDS9_00895 [Pseudonocardiaceae bacterium]